MAKSEDTRKLKDGELVCITCGSVFHADDGYFDDAITYETFCSSKCRRDECRQHGYEYPNEV